jgi:hypothetical protein
MKVVFSYLTCLNSKSNWIRLASREILLPSNMIIFVTVCRIRFWMRLWAFFLVASFNKKVAQGFYDRLCLKIVVVLLSATKVDYGRGEVDCWSVQNLNIRF